MSRTPHDASNRPADSDSDSGSSLFITQHCVPPPARSKRGRRRPAESQGGPSLFESPQKSTLDTKRKRSRLSVPKYSFVLPQEKPSPLVLTTEQNLKMHYAVMGGFFSSARDLWAGYQSTDPLSSLPTVDQEGETIAPISEGEEMLEDEHIRIVANKHLVVSSKAKRTRPWWDPQRRGSTVEPCSDTGGGGLHQASHSSFNNGPLVQKKAEKKLFLEREEKVDESDSDSEATFCELLEENAQRQSDASMSGAETQTDVSHKNKHSRLQQEEHRPEGQCHVVYSKSTLKKTHREDPDSAEEEMFPSPKEPAELQNSESGIVDLSEKDETPTMEEEEDTLLHSDAEVEGDALNLKQKKRQNGDLKNTEEEMFPSQEKPEELHSGESVIVDETSDLPPTVDEVDGLSHGDGQDEGDRLDSKWIKKKTRESQNEDPENTEEEMFPTPEEPAELQNGKSGIVGVTEEDGKTPDLPPMIGMEDTPSHFAAEVEGDTPTPKRKTKKRKKRQNGDPENPEEETFPSQEKPEKLHSGESGIVGLTKEDTTQTMEEVEDTLLHSDAEFEGDAPNLKQKKRQNEDPENTEEEMFPTPEEPAELQNGKSGIVGVTEEDDKTPDVPPMIGVEDTASHFAAEVEGDALNPKQKKKKRKKRQNGDPEKPEEEMFPSQEKPEKLHSGESVIVDETSDLPPTVDVVDGLSHGDAQAEGDRLDSKRMKKKKRKRQRRESESAEEEMFQSPTKPAELHDGKSGIVDLMKEDASPTMEKVDTLLHSDAQNEGDQLDSKPKKKKKKKRLGEADARQDEDGPVEPHARVEEDLSVSSSCSVEGGRKKKKGKRKRRDEEATEVKSDETAELEKSITGLPQVKTSTEQMHQSGEGLETTEAPLEVSESSKRKEKKKKKKKTHHEVCSNEIGGGEDFVDVSSSHDVISLVENQELPVKKKKKSHVTDGVVEDGSADITHRTAEGAEEQDTEGVAEKKKKKKRKKEKTSEAPSLSISGEAVEQSDDSVSVWKKEKKKKRTSSFPDADAEPPVNSESAEIRGSLTEQDEVKGKKKKEKRRVSEGAADPELYQTDEKAAGKKKKKKVAGELLPAESEQIESANTGCDAPLVECASPSSHQHQDDVNKKKKKKKKKDYVLPAEERQEVQVARGDDSAASEASSTLQDKKNKHKKPRRTLYNTNTNFLTE